MLSTNKLRSIYSKIQTQLFYMIPEKWDKIYLYASIIEQVNHLETGEMFFYYYPAGLLKRNPVNVYEIPNKFNIDEEEYMKLVNKLYDTFKELRQAFKESTEEKMWTSLTIIIKNSKFSVEYSYEDFLGSKYSSQDRHLIWKCKYLDFPLEALTKKDRQLIEDYILEKEQNKIKTKTYTEGMYKKKVHNIVEYKNDNEYSYEDNESNYEKEKGTNLDEDTYIIKNKKLSRRNKVDKYELYKKNKEEEKIKEQENIKEREKIQKQSENKEPITRKNQILSI